MKNIYRNRSDDTIFVYPMFEYIFATKLRIYTLHNPPILEIAGNPSMPRHYRFHFPCVVRPVWGQCCATTTQIQGVKWTKETED